MKTWYDRKARTRQFKPGDKVLILLPIHVHPLQAQYSGPFVVERRVNDVDYVIKTPGHCKDHRLCHINILKGYQEREISAESELKTVSAVIIATSSLLEPPADIYPVESGVKGPKLCNSDILCNLE